MKSYKKWSAEDRLKSYKLTKEAIENKEIPSQKELPCNRCGRKEPEVSMQYHNHDYSHPTKYIEAVCKGCHFMLHKRFSEPNKAAEYFEKLWLKKFTEQYGEITKQPN